MHSSTLTVPHLSFLQVTLHRFIPLISPTTRKLLVQNRAESIYPLQLLRHYHTPSMWIGKYVVDFTANCLR